MTDTPPTEDDDVLAGATVAPEARQHRSHHSHRSRRRKGLRPLDIAGIVVAVLVVIGVVVVIAKGHKSTSSATATTVTTAASGTPTTAGGASPTATSWSYTTLDGRSVTVAKGTSGSTRFAVYHNQSLPIAVINVDKVLAKNDCATAEAVYNSDKTPNAGSSANSNDRRSAFANYALVQATAKNCAWAKAIPTTTTG